MKTRHAAFAAAAGLLAAACTDATGVELPQPRPVKVHAIAAAPAEDAIRYSATIEPFEQVPLAFKASGYVDELARRAGADGRQRAVQPGDRVARGTVLARVRMNDYRERVAQGRARLAESDAGLTKARLDLERATVLFAADSLTRPDLDAAQGAFDAAAARVAAARADLELAANALGDASLAAPAAGVLLERRIEIGSLVAAGSVGFVLADVSSVKARFGIPDTMIGALRPGEPIQVVVEPGAAGSFSGLVTSIAPAADPQSRVFAVEVTVPNADGRLRPGMIGTVSIPRTGGAPDTLVVPLAAVVRSPEAAGRYAVLLVEARGGADVATLRPVTLGDVTGNGIAVTAGVHPGDRVIVTGATLLTDGAPVRVIP